MKEVGFAEGVGGKGQMEGPDIGSGNRHGKKFCSIKNKFKILLNKFFTSNHIVKVFVLDSIQIESALSC